MPVSKVLRRLLRVRDMEEEQRRRALETALGEIRQLQEALDAADARGRAGLDLMAASFESGQLAYRQAGLVETAVARRHGTVLRPKIAAAEVEAARLRHEFLEKRVERRQAETLIEETRARDEVEVDRRSQQGVDDWYGARRHVDGSKPESQ